MDPMTTHNLELHPDRLLPSDPATRAIARELYGAVKDLPIISPHGHTDPEWFATDANSAMPPNCCCIRTTTCSGCSIRRACHWPRWESEIRLPIRAKAGGCLPSELPPVPRHALADVARLGLCRGLRHGRAALRGDFRPLLRHDHRNAGNGGLPPARAVRTV
jgi:hypothetical protein